jgi:TolB-like protein/Tfp pilus assembly protein PilF
VEEFFDRLKQRKLVQWALAYAAAAFALIQVLDIVAQRFGWPESIERFAIIAVAIGFCVTLVLAWYHGERGAQKTTGTELLILALLLAIGGGFLWKFAGAVHVSATAASAGRTAAATASSSVAIAIPPKSIAVLPFENLSEDKGNAYFADGMQDMILTKLAGIGDLKVISRTSTAKYASHPENLRLVAQQLGVATILEGSVQKSGNQVLINVQLIDTATDNHLWAEAYPRALDNIFGVEGEVAQKVADALKAKLTAAETASVAKAPTQNPAAYDLFLKAEYQEQQAQSSMVEGPYLAAAADYRQAIALDPGFALAHAKFAYSQMRRHWYVKYLSATELAAVKASIDRALVLAPDLPEAHVALGYYHYWGFLHYDDANAEFQRTLQLAPSNIAAISGLAYIARRTGRWPQALAYFDKALVISPRDADLLTNYGATYMVLRHYAEADRQLERSLAIDPDNANAKDSLLITRLFGFGDAQGARQAFQPPPAWRITNSNQLEGEVKYITNLRVYPDVFDRRFADALRAWDSAPTDTPEERLSGQVARVVIKVIAGQREAIQTECAQLAPQVQATLSKQPDSLSLLGQMSWIDVCLGRNAEAIAAAQRAVALLPLGKDAIFGTRPLAGLAQIDAHAGEPNEALKLISELLAMPAGSEMSIQRLKLDPVWDPLRKDPRFQKLITDGEAAMKAQAAQ